MPVVFVDGNETVAPEGASILQASLAAGHFIPHLCYHPDLSATGACRLCVVEVEGRGLVASCQASVDEGMRIRTDTPDVEKMRRVAMELLLTNHDGECITCAKNGECHLQEMASYVGVDPERFQQLRRFEATHEVDTSNPFFDLDPNKCILCGICVRTCHEVNGVGAIDFAFRGFNSVVKTLAARPLIDSVCESCGECVARCPTAALMPKNYRRPLREVRTVCTFCGVGCSMYLGVRGDEIVSARGDRESTVNRGQLCVKGRYGFSFVNSPERLTTPLIKEDGEFREATWDEALDLVVTRFKEYQGDAFAAMSSSRCTNEENYVVQKLARAVMGTNNVDNCARLCHAPTVTGLNTAFGTGGGTNEMEEIEGARCILLVGSNTSHAHPVVANRIRQAIRGGTKVVVVDPRRVELCRDAHLWLPLKPGTDVALFMGMARVMVEEGLHRPEFIEARTEGFEKFLEVLEDFDLDTVERITGVPREDIVRTARMYAENGPALILYTLGITEHSHGTDNVLALANLALLTGNIGKPSAGVMPLRGQNNVQGACDMGCIPGSFHGYQSVQDAGAREKFEKHWGAQLPINPGLTVVEQLNAALDGKVKAFYVVGMDPAYSVADASRAQDALRAAEFVVVQDIFLSGSAKFADVVLPAASFAEKDGTFTNLERRVQRVAKVIEPVGDSRPDWWITAEIGRRMGASGFDYSGPSEILDEIAELAPSFAGFSFPRLDEGGIQWPCTGPEHPGTPRLHVERFSTPSGKGRLSALAYRPPAEEADGEYPFILTTGRNRYHFHLAMTPKVKGLMELLPSEEVWVNPDDASELGIAHGDKVRVASRRGEVEVRARVTDEVLPGTTYMNFHFYDTPTNVLTGQALDPQSKTPEYKVTAVRVEALG
jgi:formate dehydrogenase (NADP+) alpha subunit